MYLQEVVWGMNLIDVALVNAVMTSGFHLLRVNYLTNAQELLASQGGL